MCDEDGESQFTPPEDGRRGRDEERERRLMFGTRSPTTAPTDGFLVGESLLLGRSSTMIGRPALGTGELGAVKTWLKTCGGVRGVGGESTMTILSFLCSLVARRIGSGLLSFSFPFFESRLRPLKPSSPEEYSPERRWFEPPDDRGGVCGKVCGKNFWCEVNMYSVVGSPHWIFRMGFSSVDVLAHGRPGSPYWQVEVCLNS